ncbi:MAG: MFS transporter [Collinsella sp.]|nr:MFS transporter [Collinsella sp.]
MKKRDGAERGAMGDRGVLSPRFLAVLSSQALSLLGMEILQFVLPLHLLDTTGSGALYGGVVAMGFIPYTLLAPIGGVIADRTRKRGVMALVAMALAAAMVGYLVFSGTSLVIPVSVGVLMLAFGAQALYQPCVQSAIPHLVPSAEIERAVALANQMGMLTGIAGPVVGGLALGLLGIEPIAAVSVLCFAASAAVTLLFVRVPYDPPARTAGAIETARSDISEALAFLSSRPVMWRTIIAAMLVNLFGTAFFTVGSPYVVTQVLHLPNQFMGMLQGGLAMGGLLGGAAVALVPGRFGMRRIPSLLAGVALGLMAMAGTLALPLSPTVSYGVLFALHLVTMAMCMCMTIVATSFLQMESPGTLVGKVMALAIMLANFAVPLGQLSYGIALDHIPAWGIALVASAMVALVAAWLKARAEA